MACNDGKVAPKTLSHCWSAAELWMALDSVSPTSVIFSAPAHHHHVVHARGDGQIGLSHGQSAGCAGRLHPGRGYVVPGQAGIVGDERGHVLLLDVAPGGHVAHVHGVHLLAGYLGIGQGGQSGHDAHLPEGGVPQLTELGDADADDGDLPHSPPSFIRILPRYLA